MSKNLLKNESHSDGEHWISISDMMTALMLVFMLIAISFMLRVTQQNQEIKQLAEDYQEIKKEIYEELQIEFKDDLEDWNAEILPNYLIVRFKDVDVMFKQGESELTEAFKQRLEDFFPRYLEILAQKKYKNEIEDIRIEGHTSSEWENARSEEEAYLNNMELSQNRARKVLSYLLTLDKSREKFDWLKSTVTANGMSFSNLIYKQEKPNIEDKQLSRRVDFRVVIKAEERIREISGEGDL